jgi:hypothetical protein
MAKIKLSEVQAQVIWEMEHGAFLNGNDVQRYWLDWKDGRRSLPVLAVTVKGLAKRGLLEWGHDPISGRYGYYVTPQAIAAAREVLR